MIFGIICAMPEEFGELEKEIANPVSKNVFGRDFISGTINGNNIVAVVSRIGKVAAAITTTLLINEFNVDKIIFCGIGGSLSKEVKIGDIVIGESCIQHDIYISETDKYRIPILNMSYLPCDSELIDKSEKAAKDFLLTAKDNPEISSFFESVFVSSPKVHRGVIASGDQFINSSSAKENISKGIPKAKCVEMEGAAVAQVCYESKVPFSVIRVISDGADDNADFSFERFVNAASLYSIGIILNLFK